MRRITIGALVLAMLGAAWAAMPWAAEDRGLSVVGVDRGTGERAEVRLYAKTYAVVIGIDRYPNLPPDKQLDYAVKDAIGVAATLEKHFAFERIITLYDRQASRKKILEVLSGELGELTRRDDSVFVFWAGHAITEKTAAYGDLGYLVPFDGTLEMAKLYRNISMTTLRDDISKRIPAKHVFFVIDACYSGLLLPRGGEPRAPSRDLAYLREITRENVRQVLAAGKANETVLDGGPRGHSVFTGHFIEALERARDFVTAAEISAAIKRKVFSDAQARGNKQTPQSGVLSGLGDYVFVPKKVAAMSTSPSAPAGGGFSLDDLKTEQETRAGWERWQDSMRAAFREARAFTGAADLQRVAWERFLSRFPEDNPYSSEDEQLRAEARRRQAAVEVAAVPPPKPALPPAAEKAVGVFPKTFKDCAECPEMVVVPAGSFRMGDLAGDGPSNERAVHGVTIRRRFAMGKYEVTFAEWGHLRRGGRLQRAPAR